MGKAAGATDIYKAFVALVLGLLKSGSFTSKSGHSNDGRLSGMINIDDAYV